MANPSQVDTVAYPSRLPLTVVTSNRSGSTKKDARLVNCYLEVTDEDELWIYKRPGLAPALIVAPNQTGNGSYYWRGAVYQIFGNQLFRNGVSVPSGSGLDTLGGTYRFDSNLGANPQLIFGNAVATYSYTESGGVTADLHTIDSDFPTNIVKGFAYLDGYVFVMDKEANIWNSELNSVAGANDWNPINYIRAQIEPDGGVFLSKQLVYVVAFKEWTTEFFFNAGNAAGSPLGPVQGMKINYGCASADSVRSIDDVLFWLCTNRGASLQVISMDKGAVKIISTAAIDRLLENIDSSVVYSWGLKITGHSFYILTFPYNNLTIVYDIVMDKWSQWTDKDGNFFPIIDSTYDQDGRHVLQHTTNGRTYYCNTTYYKDLDDPIQVDIITPIFDANTRRRKQLNRLEFIADQTSGSIVEVRKSDDDYITWSPWRRVDLSVKRPAMINCGTFVKRAYHIRHKSNTHFRIQALEVQYDIGTL